MRMGTGFTGETVFGEFLFNHSSTFHKLNATADAWAYLANPDNKTNGLSHLIVNTGDFTITLKTKTSEVVSIGSKQSAWIISDGDDWVHMGVQDVSIA